MLPRKLAALGLAPFLMAGCATPAASSATTVASRSSKAVAESPALQLARWTGPHGGLPPFDKVKISDFEPALEAAMNENRREIDAIAADPAPATFENTLVPLERAGAAYRNLETLFSVWSANLNSPEFQVVERKLATKLAAFDDEITQNRKLFRRIEAVYQHRESAGLNDEQQRLSWLYFTGFVRSGAKLEGQARQRLLDINQRLATLYTDFGQNVLGDEEKYQVVLSTKADLAGLPDSVLAAAAAAAEERGLPGKWVITNTRSSVEPFLTYSERRDLREEVFHKFVNRGDNGDARDNNKNITEILALRAERANLLGYPTHAHWRLENSMAKTPERAMALMEAVWKPALLRAKEEVRDMQALAAKAGLKGALEPWDYRYYAEKVRKAKYDLDQNEVKPYLQLEKLREGMFWVAGELFQLTFTPVSNVPVFHPDVRVWEVKDKQSGKHVGLWYFDPYARKGKRSGAWMEAYRSQERVHGDVTTLVSNNSNFVKGKPGEPVLVSWTDAQTLFHEFGHALHGLSSNVTYPSLSGTAVPRDYVEFPSQLLEHWLLTPEVLHRYAVHYQTGEAIPAGLVEKIRRAATFNEGFSTVEAVSSALIDMKLHLAGTAPIEPDAFERETLRALGMPKEIVMRHRTPQFNHVFAGDGYSAGYYSYLWADTITADAFEAFTQASGPYDPEVSERLRKNVFSIGNTQDPAKAYEAFRGKSPGIDALMRQRGFPVPRSRGGSSGQ